MAMSLEELELESAELIPAREVMWAATCDPCRYQNPCEYHDDGLTVFIRVEL